MSKDKVYLKPDNPLKTRLHGILYPILVNGFTIPGVKKQYNQRMTNSFSNKLRNMQYESIHSVCSSAIEKLLNTTK